MKKQIKKIVFIGAGYVGGPTAAVIADRCRQIDVTVIDIDDKRIRAWNSDHLPVFEPNLNAIVTNRRGQNLRFVKQTDGINYLKNADAVFISVNTPTTTEGKGAGKASDMRYVIACAHFIATHACGHTIVIEKSTMPVRAADLICNILNKNRSGATFDVLSNPEFMAEGTAIQDLLNPDRILIGGQSADAVESLSKVYERWVDKDKILRTGLWSAELSKLVANAFLAQRVSSINSISAICEKAGADVNEVSMVIGADRRIGSMFLKASVGFGGSCFKKDLLSLIYICESYGLTQVAEYWQKVIDVNEWQKKRFADAAFKELPTGRLNQGVRVAVLGFAFKQDTNDTRESPAIDICKRLLSLGVTLTIHDYKVSQKQITDVIGSKSVKVCRSVMTALKNADAVVVVTEWPKYRCLNWKHIKRVMKSHAVVLDGRNVVNRKLVIEAGLKLRSLGVGIDI